MAAANSIDSSKSTSLEWWETTPVEPVGLYKDGFEPWQICKPRICHETASGSGVFDRKWTNGVISMNCGSWLPKWTPKA